MSRNFKKKIGNAISKIFVITITVTNFKISALVF